ncbi:MAG: ABC transporter permease [Elusimicrobia bacterium]|nr:ABC transporter permease [Elusimicrobiota bacterium]MDE2425907.1 ABC transporter permease [Elusimicrobiota bacterium]
MGRFILKRLALLPFVLFGVTALLFCVLQFLSPEMRAALYVKDPRQLSSLEAVIDKYGLRKPVYVQYGVWLKQLAHGQLGYSETAKMPVVDAIKEFFPATFELTCVSFLPILLLGVYFGTLSAVYKDKLLDQLTRFIAITGYSLPSFVLGLLLLMLFYGKFHWFPPGRYGLDTDLLVHGDSFRHVTGLLTLDTLLNGDWAAFLDVLKHLVLPAATLIYIELALLLRITRSSMLEELGKDYVRTAKAKGLPGSMVVRKHALRNAMIPVVTLSSLLFIMLLGGVVITETVFDFPGIGRWGVEAAQQLDIPGVLGSTLLAAGLFVLANLASDVLYAFVDPRIRLE